MTLNLVFALLVQPLWVMACGPLDSTSNASMVIPHQQQQLMMESVDVARVSWPTPRRIAIENAYVFNGAGLDPARTVVINGDTIGVHSEGLVYDEVIDAAGGILFPGFFDSHNHPASIKDLEALASHGVTTTMSMSCAPIERCNSLRNVPGLSDFHAAIQAATNPTGTHPRMVHYENHELIKTPSDAKLFVAVQAGNGSEWIKLVAEKGGMTQADHNALVKEAHNYNLKTATHLGDVEAMQTAIDSGSDMLQHVPRDGLIKEQMATEMLARGQSITPTLTVLKFLVEKRGSGSLQTAIDNVALLYQQGVPIMAGTDAAFFFDVPFGASLHDEFELLSEAGMSNLDILRAATSIPASIFGMSDRGVIVPGKRADLVLLRKNPLEKIANTRTLERVWVKGVEVAQVAGAN